MEFLVIVLFIVAILVVNFLVTRAQRRKNQASGEPESETAAQPSGQRAGKLPKAPRKASGATAAAAQSRTSLEGAREANARLDAAQHQQVYAAIAQGHPIAAVKLYAKFTGVGVRAAAAAVENLAMHPQPFQPPRAAGSGPDFPAPQNPGATAPLSPDAPAPQTPADEGTADPAGSSDPQAGNAAAKKNTAASAGAQGGPAGTPGTPEEDEISKWVKDLRPEDF